MNTAIALLCITLYGFFVAIFFGKEAPELIDLLKKLPTIVILLLMILTCGGGFYFGLDLFK